MGAPWALQLPVHSPSSAPKGRGKAASWPPSPRKMRSESRGSASVKGPGPPQGFPGAQLPSYQKQDGDTGGLGVPAQRPPAPPSQSSGLPEAGVNGPRFSGAGRPAPSQPLRARPRHAPSTPAHAPLPPAFADNPPALGYFPPHPTPSPQEEEPPGLRGLRPAAPLCSRSGASAMRTGQCISVKASPPASSVGRRGRPSLPAKSVTGPTAEATQVSSGDPRGGGGRVRKGR